MKNRIFKSILVLVMAFFAIPIFAQDAVVVFFKDGNFRKFYLRDIVEISTSQYDEYGTAHSDYQYQHIITKSEKFVYDLSNINSIGFSKYDDAKAEQNFVEAMPKVANALSDCETISDAESQIDQIKEQQGVEDAWSDGHQLYVKIEEGETFSFHFDHSVEIDGDWMESGDYQNFAKAMASRVKRANASVNSQVKVVVANQQHYDESRVSHTTDFLEPLLQAFRDCGFVADYVKDPTVDFFYDNSSDSNNLHIYDYDIILLVTHGAYLEPKYLATKGGFWRDFHEEVANYDLKCHAIMTSEVIDNLPIKGEYDDKWKECYAKFKAWRDESRFQNVSDIDLSFEFMKEERGGENRWIAHPVLTEYFFRHIATGRFHDNSILFNTACQSLLSDGGPEIPSCSFANEFFDKNLSLYAGYTEENFLGTDVMAMFLNRMLDRGQSIGYVVDHLPKAFKKESIENIENSSFLTDEARQKIYTDGGPKDAELLILPVGNIETRLRFLFGVYTNEKDQSSVTQEFNTDKAVTISSTLTANKPEYINAGFYYGTDVNNLSENVEASFKRNIDNQGKGNCEFVATLTNLEPGKTYHYRAYTFDGMNYNYGEPCSFKIDPAPIIPGPVGTETFTVNGVSFTMVGVDGGTFWMGSADDDGDADSDERPRHQVTLSSFAIGQTEVTQELWEAVMGKNPSYNKKENSPVEFVTFDDCLTFVSKLSQTTGQQFRLPTEAEWEYAARGGKYSHGYKYSGSNDINDVAWYKDNSERAIHEVGQKYPNELGLYDMSGNVMEYCQDWYDQNYYSNSPSVNPCNTSATSYRSCRGGSFNANAGRSRVSSRFAQKGGTTYIGLRLALPDLLLESNTLYLTSGETKTVKIISGSGNYSIESVIPSGVMTAKISGSSIAINAIESGVASITVKDNQTQVRAKIKVFVTTPGSPIPPEPIDLGLPSGLKWASYNVGASKPEENGGYYTWGETEEKDVYEWTTYKWCKGSQYSLTKYCDKSSYGNVDSKLVLDPEDDVAHVKWGGNWRMPTFEEYKELIANTTSEWTTLNGVKGFKFTSKTSANYIFLPAAGDRWDSKLYYAGSRGYYWASSLLQGHPGDAYSMYFMQFGAEVGRDGSRNYGTRLCGRCVRPVISESAPDYPDLQLSQTQLSIVEGNSSTVEITSGSGEYGVTNLNNSIARGSLQGTTVTIDGVAVGNDAKIVVTDMQTGQQIIITVSVTASSGTETPGEAVDLGLPSGLKWASMNVGATSPEDYGDYFSWGEVTPQSDNAYSWDSYKWCNGSSRTLTKYCNNSSYGNDGYTDTKTVLDAEDDAAHANWGGDWRMPTLADFQELIDNTTSEWTTQNGVKGRKFTSNTNGKSIFLPAAGYRRNGGLDYTGSNGYYWSSTLDKSDPYDARGLYFDSGHVYTSYGNRDRGHGVRPVRQN